MKFLLSFPNSEKIQNTYERLSSNWIFSLSNRIVFLTAVLSVGILIWKWHDIPPQVPLWYFKSWGNDRLAEKFFLYSLPSASIFWHLINIILALIIVANHRIFTQILFITSILVAGLSMVSVIKIVFMVI
ncbi:hypothetical protein A2154_00245 [Candidatus Gottesmanbacteria bacterium RBG_16_43_7]|uniref:DUF1648 domain-containing protein n=1 Tax=Candidatus Gottesmanbacteria bacterium RBG_16_43_7 TaxID=1798373 RepID=A0A1F5Z9H5_9BACT|nr:MAG: hypothetical protein A2154_00245 [Candidatus Gottesmanbacteria bacterium RBG_16_43_7]